MWDKKSRTVKHLNNYLRICTWSSSQARQTGICPSTTSGSCASCQTGKADRFSRLRTKPPAIAIQAKSTHLTQYTFATKQQLSTSILILHLEDREKKTMTGKYTAIPLEENSEPPPASRFRQHGKSAIVVAVAIVTIIGLFVFGFVVGRSQMVNYRTSSTFIPEGVNAQAPR